MLPLKDSSYVNDFLHEVLHFQSFNHVIYEQYTYQKTYINIWLWKMNKHFHAVKVKFKFLKINIEVPTTSLLTDSWCFGTKSLSYKVTQTSPYSLLFEKA